MLKLKVPSYENNEIFTLLIENMSNVISIKSKLQNQTNKDLLIQAWDNYDQMASAQQLFSILPNSQYGIVHKIIGDLSYDDLIQMYENYFTKKEKKIRRIYDEILAKSERCPCCGGIGISAQLDHYLPKQKYPQYSVYPKNLIPCCRDCNEGYKKAIFATQEKDQLIHPYFDKEIFFNEQWIYASYDATSLNDTEATIQYFTQIPSAWNATDANRANNYFNILGLESRFAKEANSELQMLIPQLNQFLNYPNPYQMMLDVYQNCADAFSINHWKRVMYQAVCKNISNLMNAVP
ncbi:HNH endonuclease signature motif containing protein [Kingella kingae]|uniref:HNH endonuclease n=1 Tax=Kingella TaxID=32257 RepID=UPI00068F38FA|nr:MULTISPECIES: HNH endonuclease signature motif containing protein [Kingella]MDK4525416.1 HNH endonuclease signature motif containing protein [Kingella kingae]MDK4531439.1 HNH endonuclease signature motif containing protein [Kingella kingae]MDK4535892.1 HNH endonuclease signature motif containing protein [Kingella kingae]MDK4537778.1 HNH endonuclease signature motif containing protein [Kingella kingae]MDK4545872.1 HNH endonuclease signature motif containing protein [Kingella kingae]